MGAEAAATTLRGWRRLIPRRFQGNGAINAFKLGSGTAIGQAFGVIAAPIITRLYSPNDLALVGLIISFVTFASVGLSLRYDIAIVTALNDIEADILLYISFLLVLLVSVLATTVLWGLVRFNILSYGVLPAWSIGIAFVILVLIGVLTTLRYWYVRLNGFGPISRALIAQGAGRSSVSVAMGLLHPGWAGLVVGEVVGRTLGIARLLRRAWPAMRRASHCKMRSIYEALFRNRKYPAIVLPSSLLDSASAVISVPIVIGLFGQADGGQFFLVQNMLGLPAVLVANGVADVLHARFANAYLTTPGQLPSIMRQAVIRLAMIAMAIYVPIALMAPFVVQLILGSQWNHAGIIACLLTPVMITGLIVNPASRILVVVNLPERKLIVDAIRLVVPQAMLYAAHFARWTFTPALIGYSLTLAGANLVYLFIVSRTSSVALHADNHRYGSP